MRQKARVFRRPPWAPLLAGVLWGVLGTLLLTKRVPAGQQPQLPLPGGGSLGGGAPGVVSSGLPAPPIDNSTFPQPDCIKLTEVCVDEGQLVMMGEEFSPGPNGTRLPRPLPQFQPQRHYYFPWRTDSNPDTLVEDPLTVPPLAFRSRSAQEPTPDLQAPQFDATVVPLLFTGDWPENFGHSLGNGATWLYTLLKRQGPPWAAHAQIVFNMPHGLALPRYIHDLLEPLAPNYALETFAEFSARYAPPPAARPQQWMEGTPLAKQLRDADSRPRCFSQMLACRGSGAEQALNVWQTAQWLAEFYAPLLPTQPLICYGGAQPAGGGSGCSGSSGSPPGEGTGQLKVLFVAREGAAVRRILNMDQVLEACNAWNATVGSGQRFTAACGVWGFKDVPTSIAAARSADVLVGMHGAAMANMYFMRPGSAVIEIFNPSWHPTFHRDWNRQDPTSELQWWGMTLQGRDLYSPGALEAGGDPKVVYQGKYGRYKMLRDRNVALPPEAVAAMLERVAAVAGDLAGYKALAESGGVQFDYQQGQGLRPHI